MHAARNVRWFTGCALILLWNVSPSQSAGPSRRLPHTEPNAAGVSCAPLQHIDNVIREALNQHCMPGCVVAIGRHGKLIYLPAFGDRQTTPSPLAMTTDTIFDLASLTKPIATATCVLLLVERGQLDLGERVATYLPEFGQRGKEAITVLQLLTHQGGLMPDNELGDYADGPAKAWERICELGVKAPPGTKFMYSDVGFIVLGELVRRVSGESLDQFAQQRIFQPLGMQETTFLPDELLRARAAPTEQRDGHWMQGEVHDPRAHLLGGVAGHAGLFSSAEDLALYAQMLLDKGVGNEVQVLAPPTVDTMSADYPVSTGIRGLGWDKQTGYSTNRGDGFSPRAFGHGGFTGTTLWIDPQLDMFVVFLSNRLHPDGQGSVNALAGKIGSIAAASIVSPTRQGEEPTPASDPHVLCGIDVLQRDNFRRLAGQRVGLITNHTGVNRVGTTTAHLLSEAPEVRLVAIFSPEHGIEGKLDVPQIADSQHGETGIKIWSLYGDTRRPTAASLAGLDTLVFDVQDIGTRFYTYISTLAYAMQAADESKLAFVVLDRPNPINGIDVAGPVLDSGRESFVACHPMPVRHGMTVGELATMYRDELGLSLDLHIVKLEGWRRSDYYDRTGLMWINPSPNMRSLTQALLYPGIGLLEMTNLSVGRGTDTPFEVFGAPWLDGCRLAATLNATAPPGARFVPVHFTPDASKFAGEACQGVQVIITDWSRFDPLWTGFAVASTLRTTFREQWDAAAYDRLLLDQATGQAVSDGKTPAEIMAAYREELEQFKQRRTKWLLYE